MADVPEILGYQPDYQVMCPFCQIAASIADKLYQITTEELILNQMTRGQTMTINLETVGKIRTFSTATETRSAIEVNRKIVINGANTHELLILAFAFTYDGNPHMICPFGQLATVFINAGENPNILLGYLEDMIVDMVLSQANTN